MGPLVLLSRRCLLIIFPWLFAAGKARSDPLYPVRRWNSAWLPEEWGPPVFRMNCRRLPRHSSAPGAGGSGSLQGQPQRRQRTGSLPSARWSVDRTPPMPASSPIPSHADLIFFAHCIALE